MVEIEFKGIQLDYCSCGIWLDRGEFEALTGAALGASTTAGEAKKPIVCPRCEARLEQFRPEGIDVTIDRCPFGDGLWFDKGEFEQVLDRLVPQGLETVRGLLKSILS